MKLRGHVKSGPFILQKLIGVVLLIAPASAHCQETRAKDQLIFDRILYVYDLKASLTKDTWSSFNNKEYDVPIIYYTESSSYVSNPTARFLKFFKPELVFQNETIKIYQSHPRVDTIPYHMATNYEIRDSLRQYNYNSPFMNCSSPEIIRSQIPVLSTERWAAMVIREYFHGFQYKHTQLIDYSKANYLYIAGDGFKKIYKKNTWFKEKVDKENELLLLAIAEQDTLTTAKLIKTFFTIRDARRKTTKQRLNFNIEKYEKYYETLEGTARYMEYSLYEKFATMPPDAALARSDTSFRSYEQFKNYRIENDDWLYLTGKTSYVYTIGFNMARLLDKLKVDYKTSLFSEGNFSLEDILREATKNNG